ncbi:MAG: DUF349 domain-containing protein, partial [Solirubrobacteraceae bacterium]
MKDLRADRIEILYGGSNGNVHNDGHGHVIADLVDGLWQVVYHRQSGVEGGRVLIDDLDPRDAYAERSRDQSRAARQKGSLIDAAARLAGSSDTRSAMQEMKRLREQFKAAGHAGRDERDLRDQFERHATALFERIKREREQREREAASAKSRKQSLISAAARLAGSSDTRSAMQEMKRLREQFKAAGHAGR